MRTTLLPRLNKEKLLPPLRVCHLKIFQDIFALLANAHSQWVLIPRCPWTTSYSSRKLKMELFHWRNYKPNEDSSSRAWHPCSYNLSQPLELHQDCSALALLTFGVGSFFVVRTALSTVEYLQPTRCQQQPAVMTELEMSPDIGKCTHEIKVIPIKTLWFMFLFHSV